MDKEEEIVVVTESASSEDVTITPAERLAAFEKEKMSRRAALGRFGLLAGAAAVAALTADELTRMVGSELQRRSAGNKATEQVAKELKNAGVAFADVISVTPVPLPMCLDLGGSLTWCYEICSTRFTKCATACPPANTNAGAICRAACGVEERRCRSQDCSACPNP
jgi:hypothetical protein